MPSSNCDTAGDAWRDLEMPYDAARAGVQIARACRALSDHDAADWQLETALETFEQLGRGPSWPAPDGWPAPRASGRAC